MLEDVVIRSFGKTKSDASHCIAAQILKAWKSVENEC